MRYAIEGADSRVGGEEGMSKLWTGRLLRIPPPLLFVATIFAGVGLQRLVPLPRLSASSSEAVQIASFGLLACGLLLALSSVGLFWAVRTTIIPFGTASNLITRGPYRFTRNPMYLSLVLVYIGVAGMLTLAWPLLLLPLPVVIINTIVIPFEEARLQDVFGAEFAQYCSNVRRWL